MPNSQRLLELALKGLEADRVRIDSEIAEIRGQLRAGSPTIGRASDSVLRKRRKMTAAARKRISEGMKRRYAEMREPASKPQRQSARSRGSRLTVAGRKKLSEKMKARWAAKKKAAKKSA